MKFASKLKEFAVVGVIAVVGSTIVTYYSCTSCLEDEHKFFMTTLFSAIMWFVMWEGNSELTNFISRKIPWMHYPVWRLVVGVVSTVVFTVIVAILLLKSWESARGIKLSSYTEFIFISLLITLMVSLFLHGREFLLQWKKSAVEAEKYQRESIAAQYENLKNQVNPHFLFNSLNALTNLVYQDQDKAAKFIKQLSEVYRYVLDTRDKELVPLHDEIAFIQSYLFLQQIRFGDKLKADLHMDEAEGMVAPLAVQMLIENAIKHNIISEDQPLLIEVYRQNEWIVVANTLQRKKVLPEESNGLGLENIKKRYTYLTNTMVRVEETDNKFVVQLPLIQY